jgi:ATP sulfurylase
MKKILCTLGPSSANPRTIERLEQAGATLFRVNLSHTSLEDLAETVSGIQAATDVPICLDTEGAQVRTGRIAGGSITLRDNAVVRAERELIPGDINSFNFYPPAIVSQLMVGDFISIDFNSVLVQVVETDDAGVMMRVLNGGMIGQNKAVTVQRPLDLAPLTDKDVASIAVGLELGLSHFALSFANHPNDVDLIRKLAGPDSFIISKIESRPGLANLDEIATRSDALLIDRGDLSRDIPIELIPRTQKQILQRGHVLDTPVYVATNLLESMVVTPTPTRAEVNDIYNTLLDGADGLVLAAETAIGKYPIHCASMIARLIRSYENADDIDAGDGIDPFSQLIEPHGGALVNRQMPAADFDQIGELPTLKLPYNYLIDAEQIATGTYSPLTGFMDRATLESVLAENRLPDGETWTLPIVLQVSDEEAAGLAVGQRVVLTADGGEPVAAIDISEVYQMDLDRYCEAVYGTNSTKHPGVVQSQSAGANFIGGAVTLIRPVESPYRSFHFTPEQTRFLFRQKNWSRVVGFHTRNPPHRGHEYIQLAALERTGADGLYINPVTGPKKTNDFRAEHVLASYQLVLESGVYPSGKVLLGAFNTYSRYAGPREAVFTALCRKNMGCSHFVIGRDHTGVGDFYPTEANRRMFDSLGDLGISAVYFDAVGYNENSAAYEESATAEGLTSISGTEVRDLLRAQENLPTWFMREEVQEMLRKRIAAGTDLFH